MLWCGRLATVEDYMSKAQAAIAPTLENIEVLVLEGYRSATCGMRPYRSDGSPALHDHPALRGALLGIVPDRKRRLAEEPSIEVEHGRLPNHRRAVGRHEDDIVSHEISEAFEISGILYVIQGRQQFAHFALKCVRPRSGAANECGADQEQDEAAALTHGKFSRF
jgi:hypothetical protein